MEDREQQDGGTRRTFFAPPGRASPEAVAHEVAVVVGHPVIVAVLESFCGQVLVLNRERQILGGSPEFKAALASCGMDDYVGKRPGEALGCDHADEGPAGCGTSRACAHCGAVAAILAAQCCTEPVYDECWIGMRRQDKRHNVEFRAKAEGVGFSVHNPGTIPAEVAPRIFQRSFSTKRGAGHGLGTYSMRLFAEQYLGGRVTFSSAPEAGTTFTLALPFGRAKA